MNETNPTKANMQRQRREQWLPEGKEPGREDKRGDDQPYMSSGN